VTAAASRAIHVHQLGKRYRIGAAVPRHATLREAIAHAALAPLRNMQRLRSLSRFDNGAEGRVIWALRDVSFDVDRGEVLGIIGRNGAGKSTLLKILSRIVEPTTGYAEVAGRAGSLLEVGTGFHPELTGRDNIYLNGSILGMDRGYIRSRFDEIVDFAGVGPFIDTPVKRYSSGMRLRLAFAVAAHLEPEILIIDEVLAVGDAEFQKKCIGRIDAVARDGRTVLFVSHDLTAVRRLCTRTLRLDAGRVVDMGLTADVVTRYLVDGAREALPGSWIDTSSFHRRGSGGAVVQRVWYSGLDGTLHSLPYTYGPLLIRLDILASEARSIDSIQVWLSTADGTKLLDLDSSAAGSATVLRQGLNRVSFRVERLYLNPGIYTFHWRLEDRPRLSFDRNETTFQVEITERDAVRQNFHIEARGPVAREFIFASEPDPGLE
jgi:lipopolysaccharide transport system ATP-binding protein